MTEATKTETAEATPTTATVTTTTKPGRSTSEFAFGLLATVLTALYATGVIPIEGTWAKVAAIAAVTLTALGYTVSRTMVKKGAALVLIVLAFGTTQPACGASARETQLRTAMTGLTIASDGFVAFDRAYQAEIVAKATNQAEGGATLAAYRARRELVLGSFAAAYHAIASAAVLNSDDKSLVAALAAADLALKAWNDLKAVIQ